MFSSVGSPDWCVLRFSSFVSKFRNLSAFSFLRSWDESKKLAFKLLFFDRLSSGSCDESKDDSMSAF